MDNTPRFCGNCGKPIQANTTFCVYCGKRLTVSAEERTYNTTVPMSHNAHVASQPKPKKNVFARVMILIFVFAILFFGVLIYVGNNPKLQTKSVSDDIDTASTENQVTAQSPTPSPSASADTAQTLGIAANGIEITNLPSSYTFEVGDTHKFSAEHSPNGATNNLGVTWASSDTSVATINNIGNMTCVGAGCATITATLPDGISDSYFIAVESPAPQLVEETPPLNGELIFTSKKYSNWCNNFKIINNWDRDVCFVFKDTANDNYVKTVYVRANNKTTITLPSGTFKYKYSAGKKWYGYYNQMKDPERSFYISKEYINCPSYATWEGWLTLTSGTDWGSSVSEVDPETFAEY